MKHTLLPLCWLLMLTGVAVAQPNPRAIVATDLTRINQVGGIALSPDGTRAVYTLTSIEPNADKPGDFEYRTHLYLTNLKPGDSRALTHGPESARQPVWSPDGRRLAFVRAVKGKSQVFVLPLDGGEAYQLTNLPTGASGPVWSPDGGRISFSSTLTMSELLADSLVNPGRKLPGWSLEKPGFSDNAFLTPPKSVTANADGSLAEIRAYLAKDVLDKKAKVINRLNFQGEATTEPELNFTHLYTAEVNETNTVTGKPRPLTRGFYSFGAATWLPDGSAVLATSNRDTLASPDRDRDIAIYQLMADGSGRRTVLLADAGKRYTNPTLSPDGRDLAVLVSPSDGVNYGHLALTTLVGGRAGTVQEVAFDRSATAMRWATATAAPIGKGVRVSRNRQTVSAMGNMLYLLAPSNGGFPLYRLDAATRQLTQLTDETIGVGDMSVAGNSIVFAKTEVANPSELYRADVPGATAKTLTNAVKLTNHNDWVSGKALSMPVKHVYQNSKGQPVDYWIMPPTTVEPGKKYPLLLNMHGGPTAMWGPGEGSMWHEFQYMCSRGYGVVYANPRGSGGYGLVFQQANTKDWGTGPAEDVLAAATAAAREPWADTARQVITGGSYAGYLTAWIVGHDNRFKAAFAQRGVYDLTTFLGEGNAWNLIPSYFDYPWTPEGKRTLDSNSPYTFVENIRTPLLIKHGENDLRTGPIQSEMMYKSLKILNRPVEYVRMPGATHELSRTGDVRQRIDRILRIYEFFERFVGNDATARIK
jgi:dipeptidyl aminopeptidase/acylaminoacyl peptidase